VTLPDAAARVRQRQKRAEQANPGASASIESIGALLEAVLGELEMESDWGLRGRIEEAIRLVEANAAPMGWDQGSLDFFRKALDPPRGDAP
jgi:hypothetical protein